jgi:hypothetical protein
MSFMGAVEGGADALDEFAGRQQAGGFDHAALALRPLGLERLVAQLNQFVTAAARDCDAGVTGRP